MDARATALSATALGLGLGLGLVAGTARADHVVERRSSWTSTGGRIVTDVLVQRDDGVLEARRLPGGTVDGIGMVEFPLYTSGAAPPGTGLLGWVPSRTTAGRPIGWASSCVYLAPSTTGPTDIPAARFGPVLDAVIGEWNARTRSCSYLRLFRAAPADVEVGLDGTNLIVFREDRWCRPATVCDPNDCHEADAAAITTVFYVDRPGAPDDGTILDADIELNAVDFAIWDEGTTTGTGPGADLQNTLTHEVGHVVGLGHTCWDEEGEPDLDGDNLPVPRCGANPAEVTEATMYNFQEPGPPPETSKRTLEPDDVRGYCTRYPPEADPRECQRMAVIPRLVGGVGWCSSECAVAGRGGRTSALAALALLGLVALVRRRRG